MVHRNKTHMILYAEFEIIGKRQTLATITVKDQEENISISLDNKDGFLNIQQFDKVSSEIF